MRRSLKKLANIVLVLCMILSVTYIMVPSEKIMAANKTYTITFRAGEGGSFDVNQEVASNVNVDVNGTYLEIEVARGTTLQQAVYAAFGTASIANAFQVANNPLLNTEDGYNLLNEAEWGIDASVYGEQIKRNKEFVLDYTVLVDPVPYIITFVDAETGNEISAPVMRNGNAGDVINESPVAVNEYATIDTAKTITLSKDGVNKIVFEYEYTGEVITQLVTTIVPVVTPEAEEGGGAGADEPVIEDEDVPLGGEAEPEAGDAEDDEQMIEDDDVPLADGEATEGEVIPDEDVPLSANKSNLPNVLLVSGIAVAVVVLAVAIVLLAVRKKKTVNK